MKNCTVCKQDKDFSEFYIRNRAKDGYTPQCKTCMLAINRLSYANNKFKTLARNRRNGDDYIKATRQKLDLIKERGCLLCDEAEPICLDFHHVDSTSKVGSISRLVGSHANWHKIEAEISKCVVLCANCHRKLHGGLIILPTITSDTL